MEWTINNTRWAKLGIKTNEYEGKTITLLTLKEFQEIQASAPDTLLLAIDGEVVAAKNADDDTRMGYVAYGILDTVSTKENK